eukprot:1152113-Pelagomonas_calceolata.AAC.1
MKKTFFVVLQGEFKHRPGKAAPRAVKEATEQLHCHRSNMYLQLRTQGKAQGSHCTTVVTQFAGEP